MATTEEVQKLAALARITIDGAELEKFTKEFDSILAYVGQLEELAIPAGLADEKPQVRNVMREDVEPNVSGACTEKIAEQFPVRDGNALAVKQIISHD